MTRAPEGRDVKVALSGFSAILTEYIPVYGYETVYVDRGWHGHGPRRRGGWYGGHYETATTETLIPQIILTAITIVTFVVQIKRNRAAVREAVDAEHGKDDLPSAAEADEVDAMTQASPEWDGVTTWEEYERARAEAQAAAEVAVEVKGTTAG